MPSPLDAKMGLANPSPFPALRRKDAIEDLSSIINLSSSSAEDPDTESDENGSPSNPATDDENAGDALPLERSNTDERACAKLLQNKINAVLDRIETDSRDAVLGECANLPSDLKLEILLRSVARKNVTDDVIRCFLTTCSFADSNNERKEQGTDMARELTQLSLIDCQGVTDSGLKTIARCCPQLTTLDLTGCKNISAFGLQQLIRSCCQLSELCLSGCPAFCDKNIPIIFKYNVPSHIRFLSIRRCDIHDHGLCSLASYCPSLQKLDVRSCGLLTASGFRALMQRVPSIEMLSCARCVGVDDAALKSIAQGYGASLTDLNLDSCWRVTSHGVMEIARHCKQLRSLNLRSCTAVDDSALKAIWHNMHLRNSLQLLNLNECNISDDSLEELIVNCSSLMFVSVVGCPRVTYQRAVRIAQLAGIQIVM